MIDGNTIAQIQVKTVTTDDIGIQSTSWVNIDTISGYLDLSNGTSDYTSQNTKIQQSTHIFIGEYKKLDITANDSRLIIDNKAYDIMYIDDIMNLHKHYEIYLRGVEC